MIVTFMGTGTSTGIPLIGCDCDVCLSDDPRDNRTRCSAYIEIGGQRIIIDTGPDFRSQMLREDFDDLDAILFTHSHKDHVGGLDDIRPINYLKKKAVDIYANKHTISRLHVEYPYIFDGSYAGPPLIHMIEVQNENFYVGDVEITPIKANHGHDDVLAYRIEDFTYLTDANFISDEELEKIKGSKVFVINALRREKHYSHFSLDEAINIIRKVGAERSYLIHMSHFIGLHKVVEAELPPNVFLAFDGLKVKV